MSVPSLTVIMTVYNGMPYLRESVQSILKQSNPAFSLYILNNGSTDGTRRFLDDLLARHEVKEPLLRVSHLPENIGRTAALNMALAALTSEYAAMMDSDDVAMPDRIESQLAMLRSNPDLDLCVSSVRYIDGNGTDIGENQCPDTHESLLESLVVNNYFSRSATAFRVEAARKAGGFDARFPYSQDLALWLVMLAQGAKVGVISKALGCIRVHPGQRSGNIALLKVRARDTYRLAGLMLGIPGLRPHAKQAAMVRRARALYSLNHIRGAIGEFWRAVKIAPLLLPCNKLIWRRLGLERRRRGRRA